MAQAKHTLKFSGTNGETPSEFLQKLSFFKEANGWSDDVYFGNCLISLTGAAFRYYNQEVANDPNKFKSKDGSGNWQNDPNKLFKGLKEQFKPTETFSDVLTRIFDDKQKPTESTDDYISRALDTLDTSNLPEDIKLALLIEGLKPEISSLIKQRTDIETTYDLTNWARRLSNILCVQKTSTNPVINAADGFVASDPQPDAAFDTTNTIFTCFNCHQVGHLQRDCPKFKNNQPHPSRNNTFHNNLQYKPTQFAPCMPLHTFPSQMILPNNVFPMSFQSHNNIPQMQPYLYSPAKVPNTQSVNQHMNPQKRSQQT